MQTSRLAAFLVAALVSFFLASVGRAGSPYFFSPESQASGTIVADGISGAMYWSINRKNISGGGSTGGGFSSASMNFGASVDGDDYGASISMSVSGSAVNYASAGMDFSIDIPIPVRTAYRVTGPANISVTMKLDGNPISASSGWLEPGTLTLTGGAGPGPTRYWNLGLAVDPRSAFYATDFADQPSADRWTVSTSNVSSFHSVWYDCCSYFTVDQITPATILPGGGPWAEVRYTHPLTGTADFAALFKATCCSTPSCTGSPSTFLRAMQKMEFRLLAADGSVIAFAGFDDSWIDSQGSTGVGIRDLTWNSGAGSAPGSLNCAFAMNRVAGSLTANSEYPALELTRDELSSVRAVQMAFSFWPGTYAPGASTYGYLRPESISIRGKRDCPQDVNRDSVTDDTDFQAFVLSYDVLDCSEPAIPLGCPADFNADGLVDDADFSIFVIAYNTLLCP